MSKTTRYWKDIGFYAEATPWMSEEIQVGVSLTVWKVRHEDVEGKPVFEGEYREESGRETTDPEEAFSYLHGEVKWDGCSNWMFDDMLVPWEEFSEADPPYPDCKIAQSYMHFCGQEEAANLGVLMRRLYAFAAEVFPMIADETAIEP